LKIPNGQPEALNERLTANIMANKKKDKKTDNIVTKRKRQKMIYKTLHKNPG
jgi:hypothetical protein